MPTNKSYILKQTCSFDLLVDTRDQSTNGDITQKFNFSL